MVELYNSGKPRCEIICEYELTPSALSSQINKYNATGSFNINDNRSEEEEYTPAPMGNMLHGAAIPIWQIKTNVR